MTTPPPSDGAPERSAGNRKHKRQQPQPNPAVPTKLTAPEEDKPFHLGWLVFSGILGTVFLGGLLFFLFTWTQTDLGWNRFFTAITDVDGEVLFNSARTALTMVTVIGLGGAALLAYRRQRSTELAQNTTAQALKVSILSQQTSADALLLNQQQFQHTTERALRERYTETAEQLGSTQFAVRMAGVFALAALADDWHSSGDDAERQVCVDLLCAYLRTDTLARYSDGGSESAKSAPLDEEHAVRTSIVATIRQHLLSSLAEGDRRNWTSCELNLTGAHLAGADLSNCELEGIDLSGADLSRADLSESALYGAYLAQADLSQAVMLESDLSHAIFEEANLRDASFQDAKLVHAELASAVLVGTIFIRADLTRADLTTADLTRAELNYADFTRADLTEAVLVDVDLTDAILDGATFQRTKYSATTQWPGGTVPDGTVLDDVVPDD